MHKNLLLILTLTVAGVIVILLFFEKPSSQYGTVEQREEYTSTSSSLTPSVTIKYAAKSSVSAEKNRAIVNNSASLVLENKYADNSSFYSHQTQENRAKKKIIYSPLLTNAKSMNKSSAGSADSINSIDDDLKYRVFYGDRVKNMPLEKVKKELPPPPPFPSIK